MFQTYKTNAEIGKEYRNLDVNVYTNLQGDTSLKCFYLKDFTPDLTLGYNGCAILLNKEMEVKKIVPNTIQFLNHTVLGGWEIVGWKKTGLLIAPGHLLYLKKQANLPAEKKIGKSYQ
ncbi:hypothetical protein [Gloeothece verrucosa]|uniref:Uncharacterized protein n=1 Tax=Gloeothece verrucosa (strain PCC 7822) TaxID=497965 RepID=E0UJ87_GLOV7|nr:hypothetical protein [Gloeothece verrucosa]ADN15790.1 hypothetical protein Cyan7822_3858 [Gloeothece verrucosa PCC 7822]